MRFHATCKGPSSIGGRTTAEMEREWKHAEAHGFTTGETLTFDDPAAWVAHRKAAGFRAVSTSRRYTWWKRPTAKAFDPAVGDVGSWVTWQPTRYEPVYDHTGTYTLYGQGRHVPDGDEMSGQVWSISKGGKSPRVFVADGARWHDVAVADLRPMSVEIPEELAA